MTAKSLGTYIRDRGFNAFLWACARLQNTLRSRNSLRIRSMAEDDVQHISNLISRCDDIVCATEPSLLKIDTALEVFTQHTNISNLDTTNTQKKHRRTS